MFESVKRYARKRDTIPGTAVYSGAAKNFAPSLRRFRYTLDTLEETTEQFPFTAPQLQEGTCVLRILTGLHEGEQVQAVADWLGMHPLAVEDVLNTGHRPSMEEYDDHVVMTLRELEYDSATPRLLERHVALACGADSVTAFLEEPTSLWNGVLVRLHKPGSRMRRLGAMYLYIAMLDAIVDGYFSTLSAISGDVEALEDELEGIVADETALMRIYALKRTVVALRNAVLPAQQALGALHMNEAVELTDEVEPYFFDVKGHADQVVEAVQALHELLSSMLDLQISLAGMRMNNVMRFLTIIATIFIPLTFIVGLYGMNFQHMPELHWRYGYPLVLAAMAAIVAVMVYYFRKNKWL